MISIFCHSTMRGNTNLKHFSDGEMLVILQNPSDITGKDIAIFASISKPVNENIMEIMLTIDAVKHCMPRKIFLGITYLGYARQDRIVPEGSSFSSSVVAKMLSNSGADGILVLDAHSPAAISHFTKPVVDYKWNILPIISTIATENIAICSSDAGGIEKAKAIAENIGASTVYTQKYRSEPGKSEVLGIIGDAKGKTCILVDDIIDSGGSICNAAEAILSAGAKDVHAIATHGVFSKNAIDTLESSYFKSVTVTNSIPQTLLQNSKINTVDIFPELERAIIHNFLK